MSWLSHVGLGFIDDLTDNALDKMGNAIKKGDIPEVLSQLSSIIDAAEDRFEDIGDLFDGHADKTQKSYAERNTARSDGNRCVRANRQPCRLAGQVGQKVTGIPGT